MTTTRQRRIRAAHRERVRAHETRRRPDAVAQSVERIDRFDADLASLLAWSAFAIVALTVIALAFV